MNAYLHHVSEMLSELFFELFTNRSKTEKNADILSVRGLSYEYQQQPHGDLPKQPAVDTGDWHLKYILVNGVTGTAVGTAVAALTEMVLAVANAFLAVSSPFIAPFVIMGWGASIGALLGIAQAVVGQDAVNTSAAQAGARKEENEDTQGWLSGLIDDAIATGQSVLSVPADTDQKHYS
ncbi:hypothetical protein [Undibacterium sp. TJN19]|uniref:hypothetical protein n=1 Tax=Undibacterium sp. TJN19 TaxID=3413055 RepID=UPI003BF13FBB